ncbi:MAG: hypothetical protein R3F61_11610 [Myxococcota bacterium]
MKTNLTPLGHARVYRDPRTGQLVVDTDSLRRTHFAGADFAGGDGYDDDYDDFEGYDDDFEGYDDEHLDDFGFFRRDPERQRERRQRRLRRKRSRLARRTGRKSDRLDRKAERWGLNDEDGKKDNEPDVASGWGATAVSDSERIDQAGAVALKIRLQHDFRAQDVTFTGSAPGALVHSIFFGDRAVWSSSDGIDAGVFAANGFMRGLLKGQSLKAGLDIIVNGSLPGPGVFTATLIGSKPVSGGC